MQMVKALAAPSPGSRALAAALAQFDAAADHIALEPGLRAVLRVASFRATASSTTWRVGQRRAGSGSIRGPISTTSARWRCG